MVRVHHFIAFFYWVIWEWSPSHIWEKNFRDFVVMDYTKSKGNITELACLMGFMSMGFDCSIPYGDCSKYDFIVDLGDELIKIQCKSSVNPLKKDGTRDLDAFCFSTVTQTTNTKETVRKRYTEEQIDYFATYFGGKVYVVPVQECSTHKTLRFKAPSNNTSFNKAEDYLLENMFRHKVSPEFIEARDSEYIPQQNAVLKKRTYICSQCGVNEVYKEGNICADCAHLNSRKVERPNREQLKELIRLESFVEVGKRFNVTDNTIRKWCKSYNLPNKRSDIKSINDINWESL